ncbi:MAG TPA: DUF167 domain-containing protein [archaeon]|jgi:uncharacterized protein (TIGR00251 family)|nr:DUF167 domain-containing protein [archaeon]
MFQKDQIVTLHVICNAKETELQKLDDKSYKLKIKALPIAGKANKQIVEIFKDLGYNIKIIKGEKSNNKLIQFL